MEKCFNVFLTVLTIWSSFGTEMIISSAEGRSSGSLYFIFQQPVYPRDCKEVSNACFSTNNTSGVYLIKPDVYPEPFEAYCNNDLDTGGWTVLQRRRLDSVNFNRSWKDFRNGFGFLGSEFWIGNDKIAVLTNQKRYQLRLDFENVAGETYYVTYDEFRISDEWGDYFISNLGSFARSNETIPEWCPANEIFSNETCERTCDDPDTCISATSRTESEQCVCVGKYLRHQEQCIPLNQCNCFLADKRSVLGEGQFYVNARCTQRSTCRNNQIIEASYQCSDHATCAERNGVHKCYCNPNYQGDGETCTHNCFVADIGSVLGVDDFYVNSRCTRRSTCQNNQIIKASYQCSEHATCAERNGVRKCYCNPNYQGDGVTCRHNCFVADKGSVLGEGHFYINSSCTRKSTCRNNRLVDESYQCSTYATCAERNGVRKCYCNPNYQGDGVTCRHNCFVADKGSVLGVGDFYVNSRCTRRSTCRDNQIIEASYQCSDHATCAERNGVRKCYCNPNYQGDGETCTHNCFVADIGSVLGVGDFYVNSRCTRKSTCQNNQIIKASYQCSEHATCAERNGVRKCYCNPNYQGNGETCIHKCFVADIGIVLGEGHVYINSSCTRKSTCKNNRLVDESYQCSNYATCAERNGVRKCYCNANYEGDGVTCRHNCFVADIGSVLGVGEFYVNPRCTRRSTCQNNQIIKASYQCSEHATCAERNGVRKCYCNPNYEGDGETCIHNCFVADIGSVLGVHDFYVNSRCTRISTCRNNQIIKASYQCSEHATCAEKNGVRKCYCNPNYQGDGETCRHKCFVDDIGSVLGEGHFYINSSCTRKSTCRNNRLVDESYQCSDHATCAERNGVRKCYCNPNYHGDGETCRHNCFVDDKGSVLEEGHFYINSSCTRKSTCRNNRLVDESYQCSNYATCAERNGVRKCYCNANYEGDGVTCRHNCFVADKGSVLGEGHFYINSRCTRRSTCRNNQIIEASYQCSDHATCAERDGVRKCYCNPNYQGDGETCTHKCFVADIGSVLEVGDFYVNSRCTRRSTCRNNQIIKASYQCSEHATCAEKNGVRKCYCNPNYKGDGETCTHNCFVDDIGSVLGVHDFYVNSRCTRISTCRNNQIIKASYQCSEHATCAEKNGVRKCYCNPNYEGDGETCRHKCFIDDIGSVLGEGHFYINSRCTLRSTCRNNRLVDESYQCSDHATCAERNGVRKCYCNPDYQGDGVTCRHKCFVDDIGSVLREGHFYINSRCTRKSTCRNNRLVGENYQCSSYATCAERRGVRKCYCNTNYQGDGVTCRHYCFVAEKGSVLGEGHFYINSGCTRKSTCRNNRLVDENYQCSSYATCAVRSGVRKCYCNTNYQGDGVTCRHYCFVAEKGSVLGEGHFYINSGCTRKSTCRNNRLVDENYQCSSYATCAVRSGVRKCYCNTNYQGDGVTCRHYCFVAEKGSVLGEGHFYINSGCTRKSTCRNNRLVDENYQCSSYATCAVRSGVRKCYCNTNYQGDGVTCRHYCFVAEKGSVLGEGHFYINSGCTRKSTCRNNRLVDENYQCSSYATCAERSGVRKCYCNTNYQGDGVTCRHYCFVAEKGSVLGKGHFYINAGCTRKSTCRNNRLVDESYQCSSYATCDTRNGVRKCYCNPNYQGDGVTCTRRAQDCYDLYVSGTRSDGVYTIYPDGWSSGIQVYCEMESNGGGWTVFQRRSSASVDFYRGWSDYKDGFGTKNHDHWLGNKYIHSLTNQKTYQLRIDLRDSGSSSKYAVYSTFRINNEADKYRLSVGSHSGNTGYDGLSFNNNRQFSTKDQDNDGSSSYDCAEGHRGAWWYRYYYYYNVSYCRYYCRYYPDGSYCSYCGYSHLNGDYDGSTGGTYMFWYGYSLNGYGCSLQYTDMKIRPV
ncbi:zonadhesin-like isoform X2 [Apostichopus japonicus]|uniref:zonadhesin-like isoform X2 n=1 Tax=Stichopus japonicus TaxID=307972 RepID=UPI003AB6F939